MRSRAKRQESETESNGLAEREKEHLVRNGIGVCQKWQLEK